MLSSVSLSITLSRDDSFGGSTAVMAGLYISQCSFDGWGDLWKISRNLGDAWQARPNASTDMIPSIYVRDKPLHASKMAKDRVGSPLCRCTAQGTYVCICCAHPPRVYNFRTPLPHPEGKLSGRYYRNVIPNIEKYKVSNCLII